MNISERDIFNFVFYESLLSPEKIKFIDDSDGFNEVVNFYKNLKSAISQNISTEIKNKLREKIPAYRVSSYKLFPMPDISQKKKPSILTLAADSGKIKSNTTTTTFIDEEKQFLIKLLNFENSAKLFVFSTDDEVIRNFKIIIQPSNLVFEQADNSQPLQIDNPIQAASIELEFN